MPIPEMQTGQPPSTAALEPGLLPTALVRVGAPGSVSADIVQLNSALMAALQSEPLSAAQVLDAALATSQGAEALQPGALSVSGPETAGEGAALYELEYLGDTVTVSHEAAASSVTVLWP